MSELPPGPTGHWLLGCARPIQADPLAFMYDAVRGHGEIVSYRIGPKRAFLLTRPEDIERVLGSEAKNYRKFRPLVEAGWPFLGAGLLTSDGPGWLANRRRIQPAFARPQIAHYVQMMQSVSETTVAAWRDGEERELRHEMMSLTLDIVCRALFGIELAGDVAHMGQLMGDALAIFFARAQNVVVMPRWLPTPALLRLQRLARELDGLIFALLDAPPTHAWSHNLLTILRATPEMSATEVRDQLVTLFVAGHETTGLAALWTLVLLHQHPQIDSELAQALSREANPLLLDRVIKESLRLYPPVWVTGREACVDTELGKYAVKRGTMIIISPWVSHRVHFERPEEFIPSRWSAEAEERMPKLTYFPFGAGVRGCIGDHFARVELTTMLRAILTKFRVEVLSEFVPKAGITLRPSAPVRIRLHARNA